MDNEYYHTQRISDDKGQIPIEWERRITNGWAILLILWIYFLGAFLWNMVYDDKEDIVSVKRHTFSQLDAFIKVNESDGLSDAGLERLDQLLDVAGYDWVDDD